MWSGITNHVNKNLALGEKCDSPEIFSVRYKRKYVDCGVRKGNKPYRSRVVLSHVILVHSV